MARYKKPKEGKREIAEARAKHVLKEGRSADEVKVAYPQMWEVDGEVFNEYTWALASISDGMLCDCGRTTSAPYYSTCKKCYQEKLRAEWLTRDIVEFVEPGMVCCLYHQQYYRSFEMIKRGIRSGDINPDMILLVPCEKDVTNFELLDYLDVHMEREVFLNDPEYVRINKKMIELIAEGAKKYPDYLFSKKGRIEYPHEEKLIKQ